MEALLQLSEVQRAFVQFCGVLQELILNHQVAHSVVQSLHNDLPAIQPERSGLRRDAATAAAAAGSGTAGGSAGSWSTAPKPASALEQLQMMAPRLTPTAAAADADSGGGGDLSYRIAAECQDNYIILQNAAFRSQDLLGRLNQLQRTAAAALERLDPGCGTQIQNQDRDLDLPPLDPMDPGLEMLHLSDPHGPQRERRRLSGSGSGAAGGAWDPEEMSTDGAAAAASIGAHIDVDVVLAPDQAMTADGAAATSNAGPGASPDPVGSTPPHAGGRAATSLEDLAAAAATPQGLPAARRRLSGPELGIVMGELFREVTLEAEMLGRIATAVELQTSADDMYVYDMMLQLQPYMDERVVAAALAQRDLLVPARAGQGHGRR